MKKKVDEATSLIIPLDKIVKSQKKSIKKIEDMIRLIKKNRKAINKFEKVKGLWLSGKVRFGVVR